MRSGFQNAVKPWGKRYAPAGHPISEILKALHATTQGLFEMYLENASDDILKGLNDAGYTIIKKEKGYLISWK